MGTDKTHEHVEGVNETHEQNNNLGRMDRRTEVLIEVVPTEKTQTGSCSANKGELDNNGMKGRHEVKRLFMGKVILPPLP